MKKTTIGLLALAFLQSHGIAQEKESVFGATKRSESALIGILYDFKQDQLHQPIPMTRQIFEGVVAEFIDGGWDEGSLNKYYRVPNALFTTQLRIKQMNADAAPKAFNVEKRVQPQKWMVHYKGQVAAPEDGIYRFLGNSDDFVAVAINGKTVLVAHVPGTKLPVKWFAREKAPERGYTAGDWIEIKANKPVDLDIVTGESPGGGYHCFLGIQKKGGDATRIIPFQLSATAETPAGVLPWKGIQ